MKPILDSTSGRGKVRPYGQIAGVILTLLLGVSAAWADGTTNFMGEFGEAFWTRQPDQPHFGSVNFSNSDTEVVLAGPNAPATDVPQSFDGILYNGPLPGGLSVGGTVQFHWAYNAGDALSTSDAEFAWAPGGGNPIVLAQSGLGATQSGNFSTNLLAGTTFEILLTSDTLANKPSATLIITDFQFHPDIPEPTTGALLGSVLVCLGSARWWRCRRQVSGQV